MQDAQELRSMLAGFTGSEEIYYHNLNRTFNYTQGMRALFQHAGGGAYWLADILATEPAIARGVREHGFCVAALVVKDKSSMLTVARDLSEKRNAEGVAVGLELTDPPVFTQSILYTDFPDGIWKFYLIASEVADREVILAMLPSEY